MEIDEAKIYGRIDEIDAIVVAARLTGLWDRLNSANHVKQVYDTLNDYKYSQLHFEWWPTAADNIVWSDLMNLAYKLRAPRC